MVTAKLNIFVAHASDDILKSIVSAVDDRHNVIGTGGTVAELKSAVLSNRPDLLVIGITFPDGDGLDAAIELGKENPLPSVVATARRSLQLVEKAMRDHVMAYLIEPVRAEDLEAAIIVAWSRFKQLQELEASVDDLQMALEHRKFVERAKGLLMASESISESEAFSLLRRRAQDGRTKMIDVAHEVIAKHSE